MVRWNMQYLQGIVIGIALMLPSLAFAAEATPTADETPVNHALVAAIAALEGVAPASQSARLDNLALAVAGLEADGPWHGSLTYRTQFVSGGPHDGFDHGVQLGLDYREQVLDNLLVNIQMLFDTNNELFDSRALDALDRPRFDKAYFQYSN